MPEASRAIFEVRPAKDSLVTYENFVHVLASLRNTLKTSLLLRLFGKLDTITLEIASLNQTIFFIVTCPEKIAPLVKAQIAAQYPDAIITHMADYLESWLGHGSQATNQLTLSQPSYLPLNTIKGTAPDPMTAVLGIFSKLPPNQAALMQLVLSASPGGWANYARGLIIKGVSSDPLKFEAHPQKALIEQKIALPGFEVDFRLAAIAPDQPQADLILIQMATSFGVYALAESNSLKLKHRRLRSSQKKKLISAMIKRSADFTPHGQVLNLLELASLYHFPNTSLTGIKNIAWGKTLKGEPPATLPVAEGLTDEEKEKINFFARTEYKNRLAIFGIKNGEDRRRHVYILGKSGTGKSTLIANMAIADIRNRAGVAIIDPHGDLSDILLDFIPSYRVNDVAYLDPSTKESSFHINPLYVKNPENRELVASGIVGIFYKLYGNSWGPRLEYILRNAVLTLVYKEGTTLVDVIRLLTDRKFRMGVLDSLEDQVLKDFWLLEYDSYTEKFRNEAISPILNKVGQFVTSPTIRNIISNPTNSIDLEDMMNQGKIIILNLAQGKIGEDNAALLGAMFISQIQIAAMNRVNIAKEERKDFFLYVDEFQNFATTSFIKILSEARKFRLNLILTNQYTAQLPEEIQKAIFGNAGTIISFVVGADDANRLIAETGTTYTQADLVGLGRYQIILKMTIDDAVSTPFPAYTLPLPFSKNQNRDKVMYTSTERYYKKNAPRDIPREAPLPPSPVRSLGEEGPMPRSEPRSPQGTDPSVVPTSLPTIADLDRIRSSGFRPEVVGCFTNNNKVLFVFQKAYNLWLLPQGGIENKEDPLGAITRQIKAELGQGFINSVDLNFKYLGQDKIEFPKDKQGERPLKTDSGEKIIMKGKKYFFLASPVSNPELTGDSNKFSDYRWLNYTDALNLVNENNTGGRLRITTNILKTLKDTNLIA
jgi:8-oxo-dGTP pyrophosphatase MutT (NUDIX family)